MSTSLLIDVRNRIDQQRSEREVMSKCNGDNLSLKINPQTNHDAPSTKKTANLERFENVLIFF